MNALAIVAFVTVCATGSFATDITKCLGAAEAIGVMVDCPTGVKLCQVQTTFTDDTQGTVSGTTYRCGASTALVACTNTSSTVNTCYCDSEGCNDIAKCFCTGTGNTRYANKMQNTDWAAAEELTALQCYVGTTAAAAAGLDALTTKTCDIGVTTCQRYTLFSDVSTFDCGGSDDAAGACTHTSALGILAESCYCSGELCNAANATMEGQKAMSGAGSVRPAVAILATTVVAVAASIY